MLNPPRPNSRTILNRPIAFGSSSPSGCACGQISSSKATHSFAPSNRSRFVSEPGTGSSGPTVDRWPAASCVSKSTSSAARWSSSGSPFVAFIGRHQLSPELFDPSKPQLAGSIGRPLHLHANLDKGTMISAAQ